MSGERCPTCDRPRAPMEELTRRFHEAADADDPTPWATHVAAFEVKHAGTCVSYPGGTCSGRRVDWRSRCLAAERERDEAVARAERAEAECGAMRAVVEAADAYVQRSGVASRRERVVVEADIERALDEWRRTRQSKEPRAADGEVG